MKIIERTLLGVKRHWRRFIANLFFSYFFLWGILEPIVSILDTKKIEGPMPYVMLIIASMFYGLIRSYPKSSVTIKLHNSGTSIRISFGDLFAQEGVCVISVNEHFDMDIGELVSQKSAHGQFVMNEYQGDSIRARKEVDASLMDIAGTPVIRTKGNGMTYPVGTTTLIHKGKRSYVLVVFCHTDPITHKASADIKDLWIMYEAAWQLARTVSHGNPVNIPLIGGGQSGIGLPPEHLLTMLISSLLYETKKREIVKDIHIVLHKDLYNDIDLATIHHIYS